MSALWLKIPWLGFGVWCEERTLDLVLSFRLAQRNTMAFHH